MGIGEVCDVVSLERELGWECCRWKREDEGEP